jgi:hypothetical protein
MNNEQESLTKKDPIAEPTDNSSLTFHFQDLNLNETNLRSPQVEFLIEKKPIMIEDGLVYGGICGVLIDKNSPNVENFLESASQLKELPEIERLPKIMEIVRSNIKYPYPNVIAELENRNKELANWINEKMGKRNETLLLSEILEKGYGICRHLPVVYILLAQEAGLRGAILSTAGSYIRNILRSDTQEPLFKLVGVGEIAPSHQWLEILLSSGEWIPVDPSTNLIGDTKEGMEMFKSANYIACATLNLIPSIKPDEKIVGLFNHNYFKPGESVTKGSAYIAPKGLMSSREQTISYSSYQGPAELTITTDDSYTNINSILKK